MKTFTVKVLTATVIIGGALFTTSGTSFAADKLPDGARVVGHGTGATADDARRAAYRDADNQCASGWSGAPDATGRLAPASQLSNGTWTATFEGHCATPGIGG